MGRATKMRMSRARRVQRMLAGTLAAGVCFQGVQCAVDTEQFGTELVSTVVTLFITDYVNNLFGVSTAGF